MAAEREADSDNLLGFLGQLAASVTALGVISYAVLRYSYERFYNQFGVGLEEVGLRYTDVLARSGLLLAIAVLVPVLLGLVLLQGPANARRRPLAASLAVLFTLVIVLGCAAFRAGQLATLVQQGSPVRPPARGALLDIRVDYVTVKPREPKPSTDQPAASTNGASQPGAQPKTVKEALAVPDDITQRASLLYFGQAGNIAVFYDHAYRQTIRISTSDIVIFAD
jgi:hypothetical protein